jgi:type II secretory pathway pseudopilin PulG
VSVFCLWYSEGMKLRPVGFTVVELLIAMVTIGVLATLVVVGYGNVSRNMATTRLQSDLQQAGAQLQAHVNLHDVYPDNANSLPRSAGTVYTYTTTGTNYCLEAISPDNPDVAGWHINKDFNSPQLGPCPDI